MHAEMHAIFSLTGMSPSFKTQVQGVERRVSPGKPQPQYPTPKGTEALSGFKEAAFGLATLANPLRHLDDLSYECIRSTPEL